MDGKIEQSQPKHSAEFLALSDADRQLVSEEAVRHAKLVGAPNAAQIEEYRRQFAADPEVLTSLRQADADRRRAGIK